MFRFVLFREINQLIYRQYETSQNYQTPKNSKGPTCGSKMKIEHGTWVGINAIELQYNVHIICKHLKIEDKNNSDHVDE